MSENGLFCLGSHPVHLGKNRQGLTKSDLNDGFIKIISLDMIIRLFNMDVKERKWQNYTISSMQNLPWPFKAQKRCGRC